ncbi:hypothetical protein HZB89_02285, partial [archaeon]|nr:hypothetical protein [archaeon]
MAEKKQAEPKTQAPEKKKGSGLKIALIALVLIIAIAGIVFFVLPSMNQPKIATLVINSGSAEVDAGQGFKAAVSGMQLSQG